MPETSPIPHVIETIWSRCGLNTTSVRDDLNTYWERIAKLAPMEKKHSGNINQKHWDWYRANVLEAVPPALIRFLNESRSKAKHDRDPMEQWHQEMNAAIDCLKVPMERYNCTQALIPLLAPVAATARLPFLRFGHPLGNKASLPPKRITDEVHTALQDDDRFRQRESFNHAYQERSSALTNTELHYASLLSLPLMACVGAGLLDPSNLLNAMIADPNSPLCIRNLYQGDAYENRTGGVPEQMAMFLIPDNRSVFLKLLPPLETLDTALALYRTGSFMQLTETDDDLFNGFLNSLSQSFFVREGEQMGISNRVPANRWLAYAKVAYTHGVLLSPYVNDANRDVFDQEMIDWYRQHLDRDLTPKFQYSLFRFLASYEPAETVMGFIRSMERSNRNASDLIFRTWQFTDLVQMIDDPKLLAAIALDEKYDTEMRRKSMNTYEKIRKKSAWEEFYPLAERHPEKILDTRIFPHRLPKHDPLFLEKIWHASQANEASSKLKSLVLKSSLEQFFHFDNGPAGENLPALKRLVHEMIDQMPEKATDILLKYSYVSHEFLIWLEELDHHMINRLLLRVCAGSSSFKDLVKKQGGHDDSDQLLSKVRTLAANCPEDLLSLSPAQLRDVLAVIDPRENIGSLSPYILQQAASHSSADLHLFLAGWLARVPLEQLETLGWLDPKFKRFEAVTVEMLLQRKEPEAQRMLEEIFSRLKDQTLKDRILDGLEKAGAAIDTLDELSGLDLAGLDQLALKKIPKKMSAASKKMWREDITERFEPLTPALLQWLFMLCEKTTNDEVPRTAKHILGLLDKEHQALLTLFLYERWFDNKGNAALEWIAMLLDDYGDDRLVPFFLLAIKHWNKKSKVKANKVISWMGRLGSVYALSQIKEIFEGKYSYAIVTHCRDVLSRAAERRSMTLQELLEELTPTLGYSSDGLKLDVGGQIYRARFDTRADLVVVHENGKKSKSLPACKKDDDPQLHKAAKNRLSFFKKNLKPIVKQQTTNFDRYLHQGKSWAAARWQKLFLDHPLLAAMGQTLIWDGLLTSGERTGFRLSEDFSLITVEDDTLDPGRLESVRLWHPMEWAAGDLSAWQTHLKDYKLSPIIDQLGAPKRRLDQEGLQAGEITAYQGYVTAQGSFRNILRKNGFSQEATGDGGYFYSHYHIVGARELALTIHHSAMTAWMEVEAETAIEKATFLNISKQENVPLSQVNPRLIAWTLEILEQVAEKGEGFRHDWRSLG